MRKHGWKTMLCTAVAVMGMTLGATLTAWAGQWHYDGPENWKWWYQHDDGSYPVSNWEQIDGELYHFDENGYLDIGYYYDDARNLYCYLSEEDGANLGKLIKNNQSWTFGYTASDGYIWGYYPMKAGDDQNSPLLLINEGETISGVPDWYVQAFDAIAFHPYPSDGMSGFYGNCPKTNVMEAQLPADWRTQCPLPFMNELVMGALDAFYPRGDDSLYYTYEWNISEDNVLHVTTSWE